jgi:hypothetical protein
MQANAFEEMEQMIPKTQTVDGVKSLLSWIGRAIDPLPTYVEIGGQDGSKLALVLSNKKDAYYTTTPMACSCPAFTYNGGRPCKHMRKHFPVAGESDKRQELDIFGNVRKPFKPFLEAV